MNDKESIHYEYVKSMKLAALLMLQGFRILKIKKDKYNPEFDVYCFRQTRELTEAIFNYIEKENGGNKNGINNYNCKNNTHKKELQSI